MTPQATTEPIVDSNSTSEASNNVNAAAQSAIREAMSFSNLLTDPGASAAISSPTDTTMSELIDEIGASELSEPATVDTVDDDLIEREFVCMNDEYSKCRTGQYTLDLSRKVISDHFGRNKACTRLVSEWPLLCRKHYQRATYNKELWQARKVKLILRQFNVIEAEFPGTTYDITLKKSEEDRLNEFSRKIAGGMSAENAAMAVAPTSSKTFEAPIDVLRELDQYIGKNKSLQDARDSMDVVLQMLQEKETEQVPAIEFLPQLPGKASTPKKSPTKVRVAKSPTKSGSPRTSARGSVKKPNQNI
ncbi:hypothetical protein OPT61_g2923 [Boeremia exigua]|uniref:Uncharacterized protein n=1 Tax=Boeremia exigua TaxID=749465 RepID=A0ACC2IJQ6_9PLEO|nr:hypothetical protein OPT61_g2923 [Boeremia exigua]